MIPELFSIGPIPVHSFGLMVALAFLAGGLLLERELVARGFSAGRGDRYVLAGAVSGLAGARLWYLASNWSDVRDNFWEALFAPAGFTFFGGFIAAAVVILLLLWSDGRADGETTLGPRLRIGAFADGVAPVLFLGYAIGRLGCQLSGDGDYGIPTSSWWGMSFEHGVVPTPPGVLVYPTPLFESVMAFVGLGIVSCSRRIDFLSWREGDQFFLFLLLISISRFAIEFLRVEPRVAFGYTQAQMISVVIFTGVVVQQLVSRLLRKYRSTPHHGTI